MRAGALARRKAPDGPSLAAHTGAVRIDAAERLARAMDEVADSALRVAFVRHELAALPVFEAVDILRKFDIPCAPVLSMKEIANCPSLRKSGPIVEVDHQVRR